MKIRTIKYRWIYFTCEACGEPIQVLEGTWKEVLCSCGRLHDIDEIKIKETEERTIVS
ncbi:hypothetical protein [Natranaerofaba carboxydovora]|uniref:hypothetical protein n=1 Tax=Natranaerofaba carboxydovora TaxID=2742683 RepID=UPI001F134766|nr:hypothetical protein [Natranaerofaba carboxydovora]UMZ72726.1 hypothetical protein ACONDI_00252 [Natranaerofaba carboxydovora]